MNRILIIDDSPAVARTWTRWLQGAFPCQIETMPSGVDWEVRLRDFSPDLLLVDATSPGIPSDSIIDHLCSSPGAASLRVILTYGFAEGLEERLTAQVRKLGNRCSILRKPVAETAFVQHLREILTNRNAAPAKNIGTEILQSKMKNLFPDNALSQPEDRFGWLAKEPSIMAFAVTEPDGSPGLQGGKDCGDLPQGGAYFRDLAAQIGNELGIENLIELQVGCEGCRLLSSITADGLAVNLLTHPTADLTALSRAVKDSRKA